MTGRKSFALRCRWYLHALGPNPLIRTSDRLEALSLLAVLVMTVLAIPFAAHLGGTAYDDTLDLVAEQARTRHSVDATVTVGSTGLPIDFDNPSSVVVQWQEGSHPRTKHIVTPATLEAGDPLMIWLDPAGKVVAAPLTDADATVNAYSVGWTVWMVVTVFSGLAALAVRTCLDRSRTRGWERALQLMAHNDDGWANRRA